MAEDPGALSGKAALVTGSSRGIGRAIALELARAGADVAVHYARKRQAAEETAREIEALGRRAVVLRANLAEAGKIEGLFDDIEAAFGRCDIFVANAASGVHGPALSITDRHWDWTMDVNARSILRCARRAAPWMERAGWGRIVAITSLGSTRAVPNYGAVGISKAAVEALTRYLAVELAGKGIVVNAVSPGLVPTAALEALPVDQQAVLEYTASRMPAGRLVSAKDVARVVAFLCSDAAGMIVGQTIVVDGGYGLLTEYFVP